MEQKPKPSLKVILEKRRNARELKNTIVKNSIFLGMIISLSFMIGNLFGRSRIIKKHNIVNKKLNRFESGTYSHAMGLKQRAGKAFIKE